MRVSHRYLLLCFVLVLCLQLAVAAPHAAVRRQEDNPSDDAPTPTAQNSASQPSSATSEPTGTSSSRTESDRASSTVASSVRPSDSATSTITSDASSTTASDEPSPTGSADGDAESDSRGPLPINPTLTPAMGISGVILLITGLAYAIIGIKNQWVYISGSAAYLSALAVTVLIVYLMNPPVSNAIQGAFLVAAFFTGLFFGVLSLVFSDITEGFGCALGGFCLSMWFLSLKDGGLITSGTGRSIFIGSMAAAGYSLSFSHYTRNYGLIASIAFSGATAAILGIDCLAGSGWKEFWLYLWNLNDDVFPLNTNTYPVTKNMKAELAGVVIIAVVGVISQMRVWKLVKEHRAKSAAQQLERQQDQDREEEELGRKIEDNFQKERAQWEATYGGKSIPESSKRSSITSPKGSTSIQEKEVYGHDSLEMVNMSRSGVMRTTTDDTMPGSTVTIGVLKDDAIRQIDAQGNPIPHADLDNGSEIDDKALPEAPADATRPVMAKRNSLRPCAPPPPPAVVPLPFKVPNEDDLRSDDDNASLSPEPETGHDSHEHRSLSKRISDVSFMRQRISRDVGASREALMSTQRIDDDQASSLAATLDDDHDALSIRQLSRPQSPIGTERDTDLAGSGITKQRVHTLPTEEVVTGEKAKVQVPGHATQKERIGDTSHRQGADSPLGKDAISLTPSTEPKADQSHKKRSLMRDSGIQADTVIPSSEGSSADRRSKSGPSEALSHGSQTENAESYGASLKDGALPERLSKVALSYRTNEWAKHLEAADKPDYEDMFLPADGSEEKPAPVSEELVAPLSGNKRDSRRTSAGSRLQRNSSNGLQRNMSSFSQDSLVNQRSYTQSPPAASSGGLPRTNSGTRLDVLSPLPKGTLLNKRESLIKNRASSLSLTPHTSSTSLLVERKNEEDMTLAQRRSLLQQQQPVSDTLQHQTPISSQRKAPPSSSEKWQKKGWAGKGAPPGFDSHQPKRTTSSQSDQKREQLYAGWRDSMRDVTPPQTAGYIAEQQRMALINERRQKEMEKQQREMMQQQRASQMDSMMRSGAMMDAHREAMRKMQANANKRI
ncbi:hypothetical protein BDW02DRAFT_410562 [Decorospora gaudefroyi]|uniref:TM7S3/TM198-like domain-containing protein n=1 Tax=Decorospora gaudefroyi TaxID=184978 RepID=A0A6A5KC10_9PLEO|nr:hypothetical protein BDW02DRAFT_410562 [Decorospora gaudefroyi]